MSFVCYLLDSNGALKEEAGLAQQQQELQNKILSVLGGDQASQQSVLTSALQAVTAYGEQKPPVPGAVTSSAATVSNNGAPGQQQQASPVASEATPTIDLNSPSVQEALNSLISSGGGILKNLSAAVASASPAGVATSPPPAVSGATMDFATSVAGTALSPSGGGFDPQFQQRPGSYQY